MEAERSEHTPDGRAAAEPAGESLLEDVEAFAALCERHRERVWRVVASVAGGAEAEDLAQEAVVRAYAARRSFRGDAPFGAWLCRIALNVAHDAQRSVWRRRVLLLDDCPREEEVGEPLQGTFERRELQRRVRQMVARLPEAQRVPIWLHYFEGFSVAEIARLERTPEPTVRSRVRAGLRRLGAGLEDLLDRPVEAGAPAMAPRKGCEA